MPSTIATVAAAGHVPTASKPSSAAAGPAKGSTDKAAAQPSTASSAGSSAQQQAALNRMLVTYARDQSQGADAGILSALGKQITAAAKALGQHVTLPRAPANSTAASAAPTAAEKGKVDVRA